MRIKHTQLLSGAQSGDDKLAQLVINSGSIKQYKNSKHLVIMYFNESHTIIKVFYYSINTKNNIQPNNYN